MLDIGLSRGHSSLLCNPSHMYLILSSCVEYYRGFKLFDASYDDPLVKHSLP